MIVKYPAPILAHAENHRSEGNGTARMMTRPPSDQAGPDLAHHHERDDLGQDKVLRSLPELVRRRWRGRASAMAVQPPFRGVKALPRGRSLGPRHSGSAFYSKLCLQ
jgi:hypothetical protein